MVTSTQINELKETLGERFVTDQEVIAPYLTDMSGVLAEGTPIGAVFAESRDDVREALMWADRNGVPVSVRTTGTGVAGGATAYPDGLIIDLHKMNRILEIDVENGTATVEPGIINAHFNRELRKEGFFFAPDPGSAEIASVGGNIATNAGGLHAVSYGVTIDWVKGLEVVLPNGRVLHTGGKTIKNSSALNLTQLFVGSEGTLGVITEAIVRIEHLPESAPFTFVAGFNTVEEAGYATIAIRACERRPVSLELMDAFAVAAVKKRNPDFDLPVPKGAILLGQTEGGNARELAEEFIAVCEDMGATHTQYSEGGDLFSIRHDAYPSLVAKGMAGVGDISVPIASIAETISRIDELSRHLNTGYSMLAHAGDGNLHPIVAHGNSPEEMAKESAFLDALSELAAEMGGVVSGEHGIGSMKYHHLDEMLDEDTRWAQRQLKAAFDPNNILTPGRGI